MAVHHFIMSLLLQSLDICKSSIMLLLTLKYRLPAVVELFYCRNWAVFGSAVTQHFCAFK